MKNKVIIILMIVCCMGCAQQKPIESLPYDGVPEASYPKTTWISHALEVNLFPMEYYMQVTDTIELQVNREEDLHIYLDQDFKVDGVRIQNQNIVFERNDKQIRIAKEHIPHKDIQLSIDYHGLFPKDPEALWMFKMIDEDAAHCFFEGMWYPMPMDIYKIDTTNIDIKKIKGTVAITMPKEWVSLSNGELAEEVIEGQERKQTWRIEEEIIGFSFAAGPYAVNRIASERIDTELYLLEERPDAVKDAQTWVEPLIKYYESFIGHPYPFSRFTVVEVSDTFSGGHGDASFISIGQSNWHRPIIMKWMYAHEISHQWFPHQLYGKDEGAFWFLEGMANYLALKATEALEGPEERDFLIQYYKKIYIASATLVDEKPIIDIKITDSDFLRNIVYHKGGLAFYALEKKIGENAMKQVLYESIDEYGKNGITLKEFQQVAEKISNTNLDDFFDLWLYQIGMPEE